MNTREKQQIALSYLTVELRKRPEEDLTNVKFDGAFVTLAKLCNEPAFRLREIAISIQQNTPSKYGKDRLGEIALVWLTKIRLPETEFKLNNGLRRRVLAMSPVLNITAAEACEFAIEIIIDALVETLRAPQGARRFSLSDFRCRTF